MNISFSFIRVLFVSLSILFITTYTSTFVPGGFSLINLAIGIISGLAFGFILISSESLFKKVNLRTFNTAALGLFFGYLMSEAIFLLFQKGLDLAYLPIEKETIGLLRIAIFLSTTYIAMTLTAFAAEELALCIPFVKFKAAKAQRKDLILDLSALADPRIIDLAATGILDGQCFLPRFVIKELQNYVETGEENLKLRGRRSLDTIKKLEASTHLDLRIIEQDYPEIKDMNAKMVKLARVHETNILTADITRIQQAQIEGVKILNIHLLSNALKPLTQSGETIDIKVQRLGKDPRQGVGYLEDGTMVVINGGAPFIDQTIQAQVVSVKHTSSGRLIFTNAPEKEYGDRIRNTFESLESPKQYFVQDNSY